jgi:hypothetical protein
MRKFKKYGFTDEVEADSYISDLGEDNKNHIVKVGFYVVTQGEYDEQGNETTPPVLSDKYMVDMMWVDKKDKDWKDFRYKLNGEPNYHTFFGIEYSDNTV